MKKLGYNKYYEHIPFIKDKLGIKPPIMSAELERLLSCKDILAGLSILNNGDYPSIMFLHTKTTCNIFICFYCDDNKYELMWKYFNDITQHHIVSLNKSKQNIERLKSHN